jgi:hypothetical protein
MGVITGMNDPQAANLSTADSRPAVRVRKGVLSSAWVWMTLACVMLGASGAVRAWQDRRFSTAQIRVEDPPFPLKDLPQTLGDWRVQERGESSLDPEVARIAGCSDHVIRTYANITTGANLSVLIIFGPAQAVFGHRPEVCYPAAGYQPIEESLLRPIPDGSAHQAVFRSQIYSRRREQRRWREEVYYSFRHGGRWFPDMEQFWKEFRHDPSMFKVQVQRPVIESERRDLENPTEQFLALLLPEIERRAARGPKKQEP